jgi:hypothetical protein
MPLWLFVPFVPFVPLPLHRCLQVLEGFQEVHFDDEKKSPAPENQKGDASDSELRKDFGSSLEDDESDEYEENDVEAGGKWIHEGTCALTRMGCKYRHEMPMDRETQLSLNRNHGLPNWYHRENGIFHPGGTLLQTPLAVERLRLKRYTC